MLYFSALGCVGIIFNTWLYVDDLRNRGGVLNSVDRGEDETEPPQIEH